MKIACYASGSVGTNCYIVSDEAGVCALIDCDGNPEPLFSYIEQNGLKPTHILLTHGHFDHIGAVAAVKEKYGCTVVGGAKETRVLMDASVNYSLHWGGSPITVHPEILVNEGDEVQVGSLTFRVMLTPGHTEGSICFFSGDAMFSGDTLFQGSMGRTDLPGGSYEEIMASLKRLGELPGDYKVLPGHMGPSTLEAERAGNYYLREALHA